MMSNINISSNSFMEELKRISSTIVWKNKELANYYEANTDSFTVDMYMAAYRGFVTFESVPSFPVEVLRQMDLVGDEQIELCLKNKNNIPKEKRDNAVSLYIRYITNNYVEKNDYYRMLNGLPTVNEANYFYIINQKDVDIMKAYNHVLKYDEYYVYYIPEGNRRSCTTKK